MDISFETDTAVKNFHLPINSTMSSASEQKKVSCRRARRIRSSYKRSQRHKTTNVFQ
jgi:hypothetical protein